MERLSDMSMWEEIEANDLAALLKKKRGVYSALPGDGDRCW